MATYLMTFSYTQPLLSKTAKIRFLGCCPDAGFGRILCEFHNRAPSAVQDHPSTMVV